MRTQTKRGLRALLLPLVAIALLAAPAAAQAGTTALGSLTELAAPNACIGTGISDCTSPAITPFNAAVAQYSSGEQVAISPDGLFAYEAVGDGIIEFSRNVLTGALREIGCVSWNGADEDCTYMAPTSANDSPAGLVISPDGTSAYMISNNYNDGDGGVQAFSRNTVDGLLTPTGDDTDPIDPVAAVISPNGANLYVVDTTQVGESSGVGDIAQYATGPNGELTKLNPATVSAADGSLDEATDIAISPDGSDVYVTSYAGQIDEFSRGDDGTLTDAGCIGSGDDSCVGYDQDLGDLYGLVISPNGKNVYAVDSSTGIDEFNRSATGTLTRLACVSDASAASHGGSPNPDCKATGLDLDYPGWVAISPQGNNVYVSSNYDQAITEFAVDPATGTLAPLAKGSYCKGGYKSDSTTVCAKTRAAGLDSAAPSSLTLSPDGTSLYAALLNPEAQDSVYGSQGGLAEFSRNATAGTEVRSGATWGSQTAVGSVSATLTVPALDCGLVASGTHTGQLLGVELQGDTPTGTKLLPDGDFAGVAARCTGHQAHYTPEFLSYRTQSTTSGLKGRRVAPTTGPIDTIVTEKSLRLSPGDRIELTISDHRGKERLTITDLTHPAIPEAVMSEPTLGHESGWEAGAIPIPHEDGPVAATPALFSDVSAGGKTLTEISGETSHAWRSKTDKLLASVSPTSADGNEFTVYFGGVPYPLFESKFVGGSTSGTIRYEPPGSKRFITLKSITSIPIGSLVDATHGHVELSFKLKHHRTQTAVVWAGEFRVYQAGDGQVTFKLKSKSTAGCPAISATGTGGGRRALARGGRARRPLAAAARKKKHKKKKGLGNIWTSAHGDFTTKGANGSASVIGTTWLTREQCDGTYFYVTRNGRDKLDAVRVRILHPYLHEVTIRQGASVLAPVAANITGASLRVHLGGHYLIRVLSATQPQYLLATPAPQAPTAPGPLMTRDGSLHGVPVWQIRIYINPAMHHFHLWNIGYAAGGVTHVIQLRIVR